MTKHLYGHIMATKSTIAITINVAKGALESARTLEAEGKKAGSDYQRTYLWADNVASALENTVGVLEALVDTDPGMLPLPEGEPPK